MRNVGKKVLLFGSGYMAEEYIKVLTALSCEITLVGRDPKKAKTLAVKYGARGLGGAIAVLENINPSEIDLTIVAVSAEALKEVTLACLKKGLRRILLEKPGALKLIALEEIKANILNPDIKLGIAYNRRFFNSVRELKNRIIQDGGALACFFDFTDREKDILNPTRIPDVVSHWGFANSSHVIDTAFYLIGIPEELKVYRSGSWLVHPTGNVFVGAGRTANCLFSYFSTWAGGGRWNIEISTKEGRYKLSPLEELQFCRKNQFLWEQIPLPDEDDQKYKPGLFKMVKSVLLEDDFSSLPDIDTHLVFGKTISRIFGYEK